VTGQPPLAEGGSGAARAEQRSLRVAPDGRGLEILDQTRLPFQVELRRLTSLAEVVEAISAMRVRGAPLIGVTAAYGLWLALRADPSDASLRAAREALLDTRPTAVNLRWALERVEESLRGLPPGERAEAARARADALAEADVATCRAIGEQGLRLLEEAYAGRPGRPLRVLTHCNAGRLACVAWGTALAPVYLAQERGLPVHVWVDETRPRLQGALTAWELAEAGVPHTVVADNAGGHLMQRGLVDLCLVGTDRTTARGDVCNKIGTYLKALAAREHGVPFYVAAPGSSIDWQLDDGVAEIPIEERDGAELSRVAGWQPGRGPAAVSVLPEKSAVANFAFDVTPARLVRALVTERGVCAASREGLLSLYPERRAPG
jgi:methylthioribose-1-phosphate isomerase